MAVESEQWDTFLDAWQELKERTDRYYELLEKVDSWTQEKPLSKKLRHSIQKEVKNGSS